MKKLIFCLIIFLLPIFSHSQFSNLFLQNVEIIGGSDYVKKDWCCLTGEIIGKGNWKPGNITMRWEIRTYYNYKNYEITINLPSYSKKRFFIYSHICDSVSSSALYVESQGVILLKKDIKINTYYSRTLKIGYLSSDTNRNLFYLKSIKDYSPWFHEDKSHYSYYSKYTVNLRQIDVCNISQKILPPSWIGYRQFDMLVITDEYDFSLKQIDALKKWIYSGGVLMIAPSNSLWLKQSRFIQNLIPMSITGQNHHYIKIPYIFRQRLPKLQKILACSPPKTVDYNYNDVLWGLKKGGGSIIYLGVDPGQDGVNSVALWKNLILPHLKNSLVYARDWSGIQRKIIEDKITRPLTTIIGKPNIWIILSFLLAYLIIICPLNFLYFRKKSRSIYLIWSIPVISLFFIFLMIGYGYFIHGTSTEAYSLNIVRKIPGTNYAFNKQFFSIFSNTRGVYDIKLDNIASLYTVYPNYSARKGSFLNCNQSTVNIKIKDYPLNLWQTAYFQASYFTRFPSVDFIIEDNKIIITKKARLKINNAFLFCHNKCYFLGDIDCDEDMYFDYTKKIFKQNLTKYGNSSLKKELVKIWKLKEKEANLIDLLMEDFNYLEIHYFIMGQIKEKSNSLAPVSITPNPHNIKKLSFFSYYFTNLSK